MQRRVFVKKSLLGASAFYTLPSLLASCSKEDTPIMTDKKIIILGAGMAGLAAAAHFRQRGVAVTVLEAQNRVGGRMKTIDGFDQGASWIHGPSGNPITNLAQQAGATTFLTDDDSTYVYDVDGTRYPDNTIEAAEAQFESIVNSLSDDGAEHKSFADVFFDKYPQYANDRLWRHMLSADLEFNTGADIQNLSSLYYYDDEEYNGADVMITNGYQRIAQFLADGIDVRLNTTVNAIEYQDGEVRIQTTDTNFTADFVVVALPLGVLKKGNLTFSPALPAAHQGALQRLQMGVVNKFLIEWEQAFWDTDLQYIGYTPEEKGLFNYFLNFKKIDNSNRLMTFTYGHMARTVEQWTEQAVENAIMTHLRNIYGSQIPAPLSIRATKWSEDPYTYGSYSFVPVGARSIDYDVLAASVNQQLFFAGEHTSRYYRGAAHGAYESGIRAAKEIIELL